MPIINLATLIHRHCASLGEGAVTEFRFSENDIVFIGDGPCADAALDAVAQAGAVAIMMTTEAKWLRTDRTWRSPSRANMIFDQGSVPESLRRLDVLRTDRTRLSPSPDNMIFDQGSVPKSLRRLDVLREQLSEGTPPGFKVFLAGDIPLDTTFTPPTGFSAFSVVRDDPPRVLARRGYEVYCSKILRLLPTSLHKRAPPPDLSDWPRLEWDDATAMRITEVRKAFRALLEANFAAEQRPRPEDPVTRSTDASITVHGDEEIATLIVQPWADGPFDTAWFDPQLLRAYAEQRYTRILIEKGVILLDPAQLRALAIELDVELQTLDSRLYQ